MRGLGGRYSFYKLVWSLLVLGIYIMIKFFVCCFDFGLILVFLSGFYKRFEVKNFL